MLQYTIKCLPTTKPSPPYLSTPNSYDHHRPTRDKTVQLHISAITVTPGPTPCTMPKPRNNKGSLHKTTTPRRRLTSRHEPPPTRSYNDLRCLSAVVPRSNINACTHYRGRGYIGSPKYRRSPLCVPCSRHTRTHLGGEITLSAKYSTTFRTYNIAYTYIGTARDIYTFARPQTRK